MARERSPEPNPPMGRTLNRASLPRDASGRVDLTAVDRSLAEIAGSTPPRRTARVASAVLVERLTSLGASTPSIGKLNGHVAPAPSMAAPIASIRRETHGPTAPEAPAAITTTRPTDVRGIGRVGPAPVKLSDLVDKPSVAAPSPRPLSAPVAEALVAEALVAEAPVAEAPVAEAPIVEAPQVDLGSFPPVPVAAATPAPTPPVNSGAAPVSVVEPRVLTDAPPVSLAASRSLFNPFSGAAPSRVSHGSIPAIPSVRPAPTVAPEEVGAVFDEFLGSAPVEPTPQPPAPLSATRSVPVIPTGPRRPPSMQVPVFRPPPAVGPALVVPRAAPAARPLVSDLEAIEPVEVEMEMEVEEMEEIVAPALSKAPPPLMSRPPAPPPVPPKKR